MELWKKDKVKAFEILYAFYLRKAMDDVNELKVIIDNIEKEFKINLREFLDKGIDESKKNKEVSLVNIGLSGIILINQVVKKLGGKWYV